jgi:hypothetical protein
MNIAIIGLGEIGSRHLQALIKCNFPVNIHCVDPSSQSIETAKSRADLSSIKNSSSVSYYQSFEGIPHSIDLAVIATSAKIRLQVFKSLVSTCKVRNILFEKVLFQKLSEYEEASSMLEFNEISSWVNCSRRVWPIYKEVKNLLKEKKYISFRLTGGPWGMGCNSIHFIDIFEWLTASKLSRIDIKGLDSKIILSKREGFQEFTGNLELLFNNDNKLFLESNPEEMPSLIEISAQELSIKIDESSGTLISKKENKIETKNFPTPFQSDLSNLIASDILIKNKTILPSFSESARQHIVMLTAFQRHIENTSGKKIDHCPIT